MLCPGECQDKQTLDILANCWDSSAQVELFDPFGSTHAAYFRAMSSIGTAQMICKSRELDLDIHENEQLHYYLGRMYIIPEICTGCVIKSWKSLILEYKVGIIYYFIATTYRPGQPILDSHSKMRV